MIRYLHIDAEMGGRDYKYSLLTAYFLVTDAHFVKIDDLYLRVKPDDGDYLISGQGMGVNGINIQKHDAIAIPYKQARTILFNFLNTQTNYSLGKTKLVPVGHGVRGDIQHLIGKVISEGSWEQFCSYHYIDTSVVLQFLRACGKMPMDCDGSVSALAKYFNIPIEGNLHDAEVDTKLTAAILKNMINLGSTIELNGTRIGVFKIS